MKLEKTLAEHSRRIDLRLRQKIDKVNNFFNGLSPDRQRLALILAGVLLAGISTMMVFTALPQQINTDAIEQKITLPTDMDMRDKNAKPAELLTPVGKMKGEMDGEFESFYLAIGPEGQVFLNRNPEYSRERYLKTEDWEPVTPMQLDAYGKQLQFIPHQNRQLKP